MDYLLLGIIVIFLALSALDIQRPLAKGHHGFQSGQMMHIANNYNELGYEFLGAKWKTMKTAETGQSDYIYYTHHPMGSFLLYAPVFAIFGYHLLVARITAVAITAVTLILFYYLLKANSSKTTALLSTITLIAVPVFFYYKDLASMEFQLLAFTFLVLLSYMNWLKTRKDQHMYLIFLFTFLGTMFSDWAMYFVGVPVWIHCLIHFKGAKKKFFLITYPIIIILSFALFISHVYILTGTISGGSDGAAGDLLNTLMFRMDLNEQSAKYGITIPSLLKKLWAQSNERNLTPIIVWSTLLGLLLIIHSNYKKERNLLFDNIMALTLAGTLIPIFVFSNVFWIHPHLYLINVAPFASYLSIRFLTKIGDSFSNQTLKYGTLALLFALFFATLFFYSHNNYEKNRDTVQPIVQFYHDHPENLVITYGLNKKSFQEMHYLETRQVLDIRRLELFNNADLSRYGYVIAIENKTKQDLHAFLRQHYNSEKLKDTREVFYLTEQIRENASAENKTTLNTTP